MGIGETVPGMRAVIVGSGMAGLASAAALAPLFREVVVLERDTIEEVRSSLPCMQNWEMSHSWGHNI
jgi:glycine/D-amino acid oxidase-like deaminating enzyme